MTSSVVRCPVCGTGRYSLEDVDPATGMVTCDCGHRANAQFVEEAAYLQARLDWVRDRIRAGDSPPRPEPAQGVVSSPVSPQTILLSVGALLLVIAASVFTAVAWPRLGPAGQLAMVVVVTLVVTVVAVVLRDRLRGTAEALAALAFGLAAVDLAALPALGVGPEAWQELASPYWLVGTASLALAGVLGSRATGLRAWSWLGWAGCAMAAGFMTALLGGIEAIERMVLAVGVLTVVGVLLLTGSWVVPVLRTDRRPMVLSGGVALTIGAGVTAVGATSGDAVPAAAGVTALAAAVLGVMAGLAGPHAPRVFPWGAAVLALVSGGLLLALLPDTDAVSVLVAVLGGGFLLAGVVLRQALIGLPAAIVLWTTWLVVGAPDSVGWFLVSAGLVLGVAAWMGGGLGSITWLAWPAAVVGFVGLAVLVPTGYPDLLEAWTLPAAALLAVAGVVSCRGRQASSLQRFGPALAMALLPSAIATWLAPWVTGGSGDIGQDVARLVLVLVVGGVLMVLGARHHVLGLLLPASAAVLVAGLAQLWTGLDALPRWVALAIVGSALVLAGARFEWLRDEGRKTRSWVHEMA